MAAMHDIAGVEVMPGEYVMLLRDIEMERLFAGYAEALKGAPVPRDLIGGSEGKVVAINQGDEPMAIVEFVYEGTPFWRGGLKAAEIARSFGEK